MGSRQFDSLRSAARKYFSLRQGQHSQTMRADNPLFRQRFEIYARGHNAFRAARNELIALCRAIPSPPLSLLECVNAVNDNGGTREGWHLVLAELELRETARTESAGTEVPPELRAVYAVQQHPDWSDRRIAESAGTSHSTLSRSGLYQRAAALARQSDAAPRPASKRRGRTGKAIR